MSRAKQSASKQTNNQPTNRHTYTFSSIHDLATNEREPSRATWIYTYDITYIIIYYGRLKMPMTKKPCQSRPASLVQPWPGQPSPVQSNPTQPNAAQSSRTSVFCQVPWPKLWNTDWNIADHESNRRCFEHSHPAQLRIYLSKTDIFNEAIYHDKSAAPASMSTTLGGKCVCPSFSLVDERIRLLSWGSATS